MNAKWQVDGVKVSKIREAYESSARRNKTSRKKSNTVENIKQNLAQISVSKSALQAWVGYRMSDGNEWRTKTKIADERCSAVSSKQTF